MDTVSDALSSVAMTNEEVQTYCNAYYCNKESFKQHGIVHLESGIQMNINEHS